MKEEKQSSHKELTTNLEGVKEIEISIYINQTNE